MNKAQFIEALSERLGDDKKAAANALDAVIQTVYANVAKGETVVLTGFGRFEKRERAARTARNPATGAPVRVKRTFVPGFKAGTEFRDITSGAKKIAKAPAKKAATRPAAAKSTTTRTATKATTTRTAAKKAPATRTVAATKATATRTAAKKAPAKKTAAKKAPAKRAR